MKMDECSSHSVVNLRKKKVLRYCMIACDGNSGQTFVCLPKTISDPLTIKLHLYLSFSR